MVSIFTEEYQNNDKWTSDGWPKLKEKAVPIIPEKTINNGMELSDDFGHNELGLQWTFWKENALKVISTGNHYLSVNRVNTI